MTGDALRDVDAQLGRLVAQLDSLYPGRYALIVTADHGQCPLPDAAGGVRLDPIQLWDDIEQEFGGGLFGFVQNVVPSEVYLHADVLWDAGASREDVAAFLRDYPYRRNLGPYVPRDAIELELWIASSSPPSSRRRSSTRSAIATSRRSGPGSIPRARSGSRDRSRAEMDVELDDADRALLDGERGEGAALAMRLVVRLAEVARAPRLRDVTGAHIDSCLDHGRAGLDFAERLLAGGARCPCRRR